MTSEDLQGNGDFMAGFDLASLMRPALTPELHARVDDCERRGDHAAFARLLAEHPEMVANPRWIGIMHSFALSGKIGFVHALLEAGVDVNLPGDDVTLARPIKSAVSCGSEALVRLLLDRGSDVNWSWAAALSTVSRSTPPSCTAASTSCACWWRRGRSWT